MEEKNKLDSLADTLFELMENISGVEESLEKFKAEIKGEVDELKLSINSLKQGESNNPQQNVQSKKVESELAKRFKKLESNVNNIVGSGVLEALSKKIDVKMLIKREIRRYQSMIIFIVLLAFVGSAGFLYLNLTKSQENLMVFGGLMAVLIIALVVVNLNLKRALLGGKNTKEQSSARDEIAIESHTLDMPETLIDDESSIESNTTKTPTAQHREKEIRNTLDE